MVSRSIKTRIAILVVLACIVLVAVGTITQLHFLRSDFADVLADQQMALAGQVAEDLDEKIQDGLNTLTAIAQHVPQQQLTDPGFMRRFLIEQSVLLLTFDDVLVLDASGTITADQPPMPGRVGMDLSERGPVRTALATGRAVVGSPLASPLNGEPILSMVGPVLDDHGKVRALIIGIVRLNKETFLGRLAKARLGKAGYFSIATRGAHPLYVMHPDPTRILRRVPLESIPLAARRTSAEEASGAGLDSHGSPALFAFRAMKTVNWWLVTTLPAADAFAPLHDAEQRAINLAVLLVLLLSPTSWWLVRRLLSPLSDLQIAMRRMHGSDDHFVQLAIHRHDEIGDLTRAFNELTLERSTRAAELEAMNNASPVGFFRTDGDGRGVYANHTLQRLLGVEQDAILSQGWTLSVVAADRAQVLSHWRSTVAQRLPYEGRVRILHRDGQQRWLSVLARPIQVNGHTIGYAGTIEDITDRTDSEEARRMLAAILDSSPDFVAMTDPAGRVRYVNPAAMRVRGLTRLEQALGTTIDHHFPPATVQRLQQEALPTAIAQGYWTGETAIWDNDHHEVPIHHIVLAGKTAEGKVEYLASLMRDVSAAQQADRALRESEQHMRTIADNVPALVSYLDTRQRFSFANRTYRTWLGLEPSALIGRSLLEVYGLELHRRIEPYFNRAIRGEVVEYERDITTLSGLREIHVTQIPDRNGEGEVIGLHVLMDDVTAKNVEARRLLQLVQFDALTGLLNRAGFERSLDEAMSRCRQSKRMMALMYLDIDHFKAINDSFGHLAGDGLLREFGRRLAESLRSSDVVCRIGGDEFTVILEQIALPEHATTVADKILAAMQAPFILDGHPMATTTSIGVVFFEGGDAASDDLIRRADAALYDCKRAGRNRYRIADHD